MKSKFLITSLPTLSPMLLRVFLPALLITAQVTSGAPSALASGVPSSAQDIQQTSQQVDRLNSMYKDLLAKREVLEKVKALEQLVQWNQKNLVRYQAWLQQQPAVAQQEGRTKIQIISKQIDKETRELSALPPSRELEAQLNSLQKEYDSEKTSLDLLSQKAVFQNEYLAFEDYVSGEELKADNDRLCKMTDSDNPNAMYWVAGEVFAGLVVGTIGEGVLEDMDWIPSNDPFVRLAGVVLGVAGTTLPPMIINKICQRFIKKRLKRLEAQLNNLKENLNPQP